MKVVFKGKGRGNTSNLSGTNLCLLKEGEMYEASTTTTDVTGEIHCGVRIEEKEILYPASCFFNLTSAIEEYSAKQGIIGYVPTIGQRATLIVSARLDKVSNTIDIQYVKTSAIEQMEEVAPDWYLLKTMSGSYYIAEVNPEARLRLTLDYATFVKERDFLK